MRKSRTSVYVIVTCLMLVSVSVLAQEQDKNSGGGGQNVTICHKGETLILSKENANRFLERGATQGTCPQDTSDSEQSSEKKGKDLEPGTTGNTGQGKSKVTICHEGKVTITISEAALSAHLKHGDRVGTCRGKVPQSGQSIGQTGKISQPTTVVKDSKKDPKDEQTDKKSSDKNNKAKKDQDKKSKKSK